MEKSLAKSIAKLFHPLVMTSLAMLIMINSGSSLSVLQPEVKSLTMLVLVFFTVVLPVLTFLIFYFVKIIPGIEFENRQERILPISIIIIIYMLAFFMLRKIPQLTGEHIVFVFCAPATLFVALIINNFIKISLHMTGTGMLTALLLILVLFHYASIELVFIITVLVTGILGTALLYLKEHNPLELIVGYMTGLLVTFSIMAVYIF